MILTILFSIALDTMPIKPLPVLLPRPVKSETTQPKQNDKNKNRKIDDANRRVLGNCPADLVGR